jgi:DNA-binding cell septation regulator SpoVG
MNYTVKINEVNNKESNVKAFATVVFGESFKICNIAVVKNKEGNLFVSMPSYKTNERTEHNEAVFKDICNPITAEFQKELSQAILSAYDRRSELGKNALSIGNPENMGEPAFTVAVTPYEREGSNLRGLGRIYFEDSFVVSNVSVLQGKNGMFVSMPSYKTNQQINGKPVYQDICFPVTKEFREKLYGGVLAAYEEAKNKVNEQVQQIVPNSAQQSQEMQTADSRIIPREDTPFR